VFYGRNANSIFVTPALGARSIAGNALFGSIFPAAAKAGSVSGIVRVAGAVWEKLKHGTKNLVANSWLKATLDIML
jgi:hypothetical protein